MGKIEILNSIFLYVLPNAPLYFTRNLEKPWKKGQNTRNKINGLNETCCMKFSII